MLHMLCTCTCMSCQQKPAVCGHVLVPKIIDWLPTTFHKALWVSALVLQTLFVSIHNVTMAAYGSSIWWCLLQSLLFHPRVWCHLLLTCLELAIVSKHSHLSLFPLFINISNLICYSHPPTFLSLYPCPLHPSLSLSLPLIHVQCVYIAVNICSYGICM